VKMTSLSLIKLSALLLLAILTSAPAQAQLPIPVKPGTAKTIYIMPVGDSITDGYDGTPNFGGYRYRLAQELLDVSGGANYPVFNFNFVGSLSDNSSALGSNAAHDGYGGYTVEPLPLAIFYGPFHGIYVPTLTAADPVNIIARDMAAYKPDVVLILLGTNNVGTAGQNPDLTHAGGFEAQGNFYTPATLPNRSAIGDYSALLTQIFQINPKVGVLVGGVPHQDPGGNVTPTNDANVTVFNNDLIKQVALLKRLGYNIGYVAGTALPWSSTTFIDSVHPLQPGFDKMADAWYTALTGLTPPPTPATP